VPVPAMVVVVAVVTATVIRLVIVVMRAFDVAGCAVPHRPRVALTRLSLSAAALKQNRRVADKAGMAALVNIALGGVIGAAIVIGLWLLASLGDDLRREVRRSERQR
jgi:hypothetical protein